MVTENEPQKDEKVAGGDGQNPRGGSENLTDEVKSRDAIIIKLEQAVAAKESEIAALKKELDGLKQTLDELHKTIAQAVVAYKGMVMAANPGLPAELITGDTIEAINESVKNAHAIMEKVRQEMEAAAARTRIPAGAPQRTALDLSGLSSREKIQQGLK